MQNLNAEQILAQLRPALERRDRRTINAIIARLVELRAPLGRQWRSMAMLANTHGEVTLARQAFEMHVAAMGNDPRARFELAALLAMNGQVAEAKEILADLPPDIPDPVSRAHIEGTTALNMGDRKSAVDQLTKAVTLGGSAGPSWLSLSMATDLGEDQAVAGLIVKAEQKMSTADNADRGAYYYALGKVHADRGDAEKAFVAFAKGADAIRKERRYDRATDLNDAVDALEGYSIESCATIAAGVNRGSASPIFVVGMPRSGTTLVEQILVSHSEVANGGEINRMAFLNKEVGGRSFAALLGWSRRGGDPNDLADHYRHLVGDYFGTSDRIVDKSLNNARYLGLITAIFPDAPLIWMRRDPLDCGWSCFRNYFSTGNAWSFDLGDIAYHMQLEERLFRRWHSLLGERLLVVPFEEIASAPQPWIARILDHCGLGHEQACFRPHETQRVVTTASVSQVREAINTRGIGSAKPYEQWLQPLIDGLADEPDLRF